jgi:serine/threonine-protein kinase RsbT
MTCEAVGQRITNEAHLKVALFKTGQLCKQLGFSAVATSKITTAASELIRNILKYADNGQFTITLIDGEGKKGIEMSVSDQGASIVDLPNAMRDHYSSTGTLGLGLPGVERLMDCFCIQSRVGKGTLVMVRKFL